MGIIWFAYLTLVLLSLIMWRRYICIWIVWTQSLYLKEEDIHRLIISFRLWFRSLRKTLGSDFRTDDVQFINYFSQIMIMAKYIQSYDQLKTIKTISIRVPCVQIFFLFFIEKKKEKKNKTRRPVLIPFYLEPDNKKVSLLIVFQNK